MAPPGPGPGRSRLPRHRSRHAGLRAVGEAGRRRRLPRFTPGGRRRGGVGRRRGDAVACSGPRLGCGGRLGPGVGGPGRGGPTRRLVGRPPEHVQGGRGPVGPGPAREVVVHAALPVRRRGRTVALGGRVGQLPGLGAPPRHRPGDRRARSQRLSDPGPQLLPGQRKPGLIRRPRPRPAGRPSPDHGRLEPPGISP